MKRKFLECAVLLGVVMSVVFLAQTQDGLGHSKNSHDPAFHVDSAGISTGYDRNHDDPRELSFQDSGTCGPGHNWGEGWYYKGGELNGVSMAATNDPDHRDHPVDTTMQQVYTLRVRAWCMAGDFYCKAGLKPSLDDVDALPLEDAEFQGSGTIELEFSSVNYHRIRGGFWYRKCVEYTREGTSWGPVKRSIWIKIKKKEKISKNTTSIDVLPIGDHGQVSASYTHGYEEKKNDLHARGFGFAASIYGDLLPGFVISEEDPVVYKQDKSSYAAGYIEKADSGEVCALYMGVDDHTCPGSQ